MEDRYGKTLKAGQLIKVIGSTRMKYFYIEQIGQAWVIGKRVNKDFSFHYRDKVKDSKLYLFKNEAEFEIVEPSPEAFKEALRTLHFIVDEILNDFGIILNYQYKTMQRAVKFENGSYGIILNRMYLDMSDIDLNYDRVNVFENLSYEELEKKWKIKMTNSGAKWIQSIKEV